MKHLDSQSEAWTIKSCRSFACLSKEFDVSSNDVLMNTILVHINGGHSDFPRGCHALALEWKLVSKNALFHSFVVLFNRTISDWTWRKCRIKVSINNWFNLEKKVTGIDIVFCSCLCNVACVPLRIRCDCLKPMRCIVVLDWSTKCIGCDSFTVWWLCRRVRC